MAGILWADADPITVPNAGFEHRGTYDPFAEGTDKYNQFNQETWRHWQRAFNGGPLRVWNPGVPGTDEVGQGAIDVGFGGDAPEGDYVVLVRSRYSDGLNSDGGITFEAATQLLTETFDPTTAYTLTAKVGRPVGSVNYSPGWEGYAVQLAVGGTNVDGAQYAGRVDGGTVIAQDANSMPVPVDTFVTSTVVYTPDPAHAELAGQALQIRLAALENPDDLSLTSWVVFDDVTLETGAAFIPPFLITEFDYSPEDQMVTLTWPSSEGANYAVKVSTDLTNWDGDLDDGVEADAGETTTRSFSVAGLASEGGELFFRIERN